MLADINYMMPVKPTDDARHHSLFKGNFGLTISACL
jgi:hypothetical protein